MSVIYYNRSSIFSIPNNWVKKEKFVPYDVNEQNQPWKEGVDSGTRYQLISCYEEHYGILARIYRATLGVMFSLVIIGFIFKSGRKLASDLLFNSVKTVHLIRDVKDHLQSRTVHIYVSIAGNPAHMGHMHMIALAIHRLIQEGYQIGQVQVALSSEAYLKNKVHWSNVSIEKHNQELDKNSKEQSEMLKVFIPREKRIKFLNAAIQQAKEEKVFDEELNIDYFDDQKGFNNSISNGIKTFQVCGADFAEEMGVLFGSIKHAVIVTRNGQMPLGITETRSDHHSRLIAINSNPTNTYSSSKIQNGAYEQLPAPIREEFKRLHLAAQTAFL